MELAKNEEINALLEFYRPLLTTKQQEYMQLYYGDDYSLGEIADNFAVSRQAVYDNIRRTEQTLREYEEKLHLHRQFIALNRVADRLADYVSDHYPKDSDLLSLIHRLDNLEEE